MRKIISFLLFLATIYSQNCCDALESATENCGGLGCYIPQCTDSCEWEPMQCWSSTGYCWCVNEQGQEIEGTSTPSWQGYPDCEDFNFSISGDVNGDEQVDVLDIVMIVGFIIGTNFLSEDEASAADYNSDESIDVLDVVAMINLIINPSEEEVLPEECYLVPDPGPCFGYVTMYFFNQETQSCEMFVYGGCAGTVPFEFLSECQSSCE